jgi:hypothetical protein
METTAKTPYEEYLKQSLVEERARLDSLYNEFAKSNPIKKAIIKRRIQEALQNIDLLQKDLEKYMHGLSWLREPSKERDEKAEHLPKLEKEAVAPTPVAKPAPGAPAKPVPTRPTIGKPIGAPGSAPAAPAIAPARPTIGSPIGSKPMVGTPVASRPTVGTPVASRPKIGTPIGTPALQNQPPAQQPPAEGQQPAVTRPVVGTPVKRPVIGTPIGKPKPTEETENKESDSTSS